MWFLIAISVAAYMISEYYRFVCKQRLLCAMCIVYTISLQLFVFNVIGLQLHHNNIQHQLMCNNELL